MSQKRKNKKSIWEYLNAANQLIFDDPIDKEKLKSLEKVANKSI